MKFVVLLTLVAAANAFPTFFDQSAFKGLAKLNFNFETFANQLSQLKMIAKAKTSGETETEEPVPYKLATEEPVPYAGETEEPVPYENPEASEHMPVFELPSYEEADAPEFFPVFVNVLPFNEEAVPYKLVTEEPVPYKFETEEPVPYENPEAPEHMPVFELPVYEDGAPENFALFVNVMPFTEEPVPYKLATEEPVPYKFETEEPVPYENPEAPEHMAAFELPEYDADAPMIMPAFVNVRPVTEEPVPY